MDQVCGSGSWASMCARSVSTIIPVLFAIALIATGTASAQPTIPFKSRELQPGRKFSQQLLGVPGVSESSGQLSHSYPIEIPSGRGITPSIALEYSSSAGLSEFGYGWELTLPTIERSQRNGVPDYVHDLYRFKNGHSVSELIATGVTTAGGGIEYRERVERSFNRYLRYGNQWRIQTQKGVRYELGSANVARAGKNVALGLSGTAAWFVDRIIDSNNNYALYEYAPDLAGRPQIRWIRYNGNAGTNLLPGMTVEFVWATHFGAAGDVFSWRSGYLRRMGGQRLDTVVLRVPKHAGNTSVLTPEVRTSRFTYASSTVTIDRVFYLQSAGIDGFPSVQFEYSQLPANGQLDTVSNIPVNDLNFPNLIGKQDASSGGENTTIAISDMTGDAVPDVVESCNPGSGSWTIWVNNGSQLNRTTALAPYGVTPHPVPDQCAIRRQVGNTTIQDLLDLDGDGFLDVVYVGGTTMYYCPGIGTGFAPCTTYSGGVPPALREVDTSFANVTLTTTDLVDFNADGRVDILKSSSGVLQYYKNGGPGAGFSPPITFSLPACPYPGVTACLRGSENIPQSGVGNRRQFADLRDVNGDGLPDYISTPWTSTKLTVAYGTGGEFAKGPSPEITEFFGLGTQSGGDYRATTDLVDVNGDGLIDFTTMDCSTSTLTVRYNNGRNWDPTARNYTLSGQGTHVAPCLTRQVGSGTTVMTHSSFVDFTGDGISDFVSVLISGGANPTLQVKKTIYTPPRRLIAVRSLSGNNVTTVGYRSQQPSKQVPVHVVSSVVRSRTPLYSGESARVTTHETAYEYSSPEYNGAERSFMGFGTVTATAPIWASRTSTEYHTDLARQGLAWNRFHINTNAIGSPTLSLSYYTTVNLGTRTWARLDRTDETPDGIQTRRTDYTSYDAYGNSLTWTNNSGMLFTRAYRTRSDDSFLLHVPIEEYSTTFGAMGSRTRRYYDTQVFGDIPSKGNTVRVEREVVAGYFVAKKYFYDSDGNMSREQDELNYTTSYGYDVTYRRFGTSVVDSVGEIRRQFHALNDVIAEDCGPQYSGATYRCSRTEVDVLGREIEKWVPTLSGGVYAPVRLSAAVYSDFTYPLQTLIVERSVSRKIEYRDGFGNSVQQRVEETPGVFRVWETAYDALGKPVRDEQARRESSTAYTHTTTSEAWMYEHDYVNDSIERVTHPRDSAAAPFESATRVNQGFKIVATDEDGVKSTFHLDLLRRVSMVDRAKNGTLARTVFTRNAQGFVSEVQDPNLLTTLYTRNLMGWITNVRPPDASNFIRTYNDRGQVATSTDPRGMRMTYGYDAPGRLISMVSGLHSAIRTVNATTSYYDATSPTQVGWKRTEVSDGITQTYTYNPEGAVASLTSQFGLHAGTAAFNYSIGRRLDGVVYPDGEAITYTSNLDDSIQTVREGSIILGSYLYEDDGQVSVLTNQLGLAESHTYDSRMRRVAVSSTNTAISAGDLVDDSIALSPSSMVTRLERRGLRPGLIPRPTPDVDVINYENLSRLASVQRNGIVIASYAYDLGGRLTDFRDTPQITSSSASFQFDRLSQRTLASSTNGTITDSFAFDASGNVVSDNRVNASGLGRTRVHAWDALNRYVRTNVDAVDNNVDGYAEYFYSPSSKLTRVVSPGQGLVADDNLYVGQWARKNMATGAWTNTVHANDSVLGESTGPRFEMPHRTIQQTVSAVSNDLGQVIRQEEFTPYGARSAGASTGRNELHFHGLRSDEVMLAGQRAYDPSSGVWLGRDTLVLESPDAILSEPRLSAMYEFNYGNPMGLRDPSGTQPAPDGDYTPDYVRSLKSAPADYVDSLATSGAAAHDVVQPKVDAALNMLPGYSATVAAKRGDYGSAVAHGVIDVAGTILGARLAAVAARGLRGWWAGLAAKSAPAAVPTSRWAFLWAPTSRSATPSWSTVRSRFWSSEGAKPGAAARYGGSDNVERMLAGKPPQRYSSAKGGMEKMELSHEPIPLRDGGRDFVPRWPQDHAAVDIHRFPGY